MLVEEERHKGRVLESMNALTDPKVELANPKEALRVHEGQMSTDRSAMGSTI